MRQLKVDLGELAFAFESGFHELSNYLDQSERLALYNIEA